MCDGCEQSDRQRVEFELRQDAVDETRSFAVLVYTIECVTGGLDDNVGMLRVSQSGGMVEMWDVM
jgi:hypothetical protein